MASSGKSLRCGNHRLNLDRPRVMGVINVTPDSFSDGARLLRQGRPEPEHAARVAEEMLGGGAHLLDVGGESTRPGACPVDEDEELRRVIPVVERLARLDTIVSIDTSKPRVAAEALAAGASMVNDVRALREPGMPELLGASEAAICVMHMQGEPRTMQEDPSYSDVVVEVRGFLEERVAAARQAGIAEERIAIDPGFGFGKSLAHNLTLLRRLDEIAALGYPVLAGVSRKGMIGALTGKPVNERVHGSVAAAVLAALAGARILRTHDVAATVDALAVAQAALEPDDE